MDDSPDTALKERAAREGGHTSYEADLYGWALEQAVLLRAGRVTEIDAENIAEELGDLGEEQYDKLESALRLILMHLLKWDHQPERRSRSWHVTIRIQRRHASKVLQRNPGLKSRVAEALHGAYHDARLGAADETDLEEETFPIECPYSWDAIITREISWPPRE